MAKKRILIADDDQVSREAVGEFLQEEGYEVALAADGQEVLDLVPLFQPDLVLTDLDMPNLNGIGVLARVRLTAPSLPVMIFTAQTDIGARREAEKLGACDYLNKPLDFRDAMRRIRQTLSKGSNR